MASIPVICLAGPTGAGKTALAVRLARATGGEIVNADSRQVYAAFPIITAQPSRDEMGDIPHRLYGFMGMEEKINAGKWRDLAQATAREIRSRGKIPIFVGGTGLYFQALLRGLAEIPPIPLEVKQKIQEDLTILGAEYCHGRLGEIDAEYAAKAHPRDANRIGRALEVYEATGKTFSWWHKHSLSEPVCKGPLFVMGADLGELTPRLAARIDKMLAGGALEEARAAYALCANGHAPAWTGIGCAEIFAWLENRFSLEEARQLWLANTRAYAKRQLTWFRARGEAIWLKGKNMDEIFARCLGQI